MGNPGSKPPVWGDVVDIFKPVITNPGVPSVIEFVPTNSRVFHIGDNAMENSSCLGALLATPLSGSAFYFEFDVVDSPSQVQIEVKDICGVDYDTNTLRLIREGGQVIREGTIAKGSGSQGRVSIDLGMQTLQPGKYQLRVESVRNQNRKFPRTPQGDRDDFLIGNVKVHSDRPLLKVGYRAGE